MDGAVLGTIYELGPQVLLASDVQPLDVGDYAASASVPQR